MSSFPVRALISATMLLCLAAFTTPLRAANCAASVQLSVNGPDANGQITGTVSWNLVSNGASTGNYVHVVSPWHGLYSNSSPQLSGSASFTESSMCTRGGTYQIFAEVAAGGGCGAPDQWYASQSTPFTVPPTVPTLTISPSAPDANGIITFTVNWNYPNTSSPHDRDLCVYQDGGSSAFHHCDIGYSNTDGVSPSPGSGTFTVDTSCYPEGDYKWVGNAKNYCSGETGYAEAPVHITGGTPQHVTINLAKNGTTPSGQDNYELRGHYEFPTSTTVADRSLVIDKLPDPARHIAGGFVAAPGAPNASGDFGPITVGALDDVTTFQVTATNTHCTPAKIAKAVASGGGCGCSIPNPVRLSSGDMYYSDSEPLPQQSVFHLTRSYDSDNAQAGAFGVGWTSLFDAGLTKYGSDPNTVAVITTENNARYVFWKNGTTYTQLWPSNGTAAGTLTESGTTLTMREPQSQMVRTFDSTSGHLTSFTSLRDQRTVTVTYDANHLPTRIDDSWGTASLLFTTNASGRVTEIDVAGRPDIVWKYQYTNDSLTSVIAPDNGVWRSYEYTAGKLSAVRDPLGNLIESHTYDAGGRATNSIGPGGDISSIVYDTGTGASSYGTHVTYASGETSDYAIGSVGGGQRTTYVSGSCSSCGSDSATYVYDERGHVIREQDARGYVRESTYAAGVLLSSRGPLQPSGCDPQTDANHCRLTSDLLAAATLTALPLTRTTTYTYGDANWRDLPTTVSSASVLSTGGTRDETMTYDAVTGEVLTRSITGWTGTTLRQETHTTTTTLYNGTEGAAFNPGGAFNSAWVTLAQPARRRKSVDGPRTDVSDVTQFVYYPFDSFVPATWRGRLAAVRNALGQIVSFSDYDVFGNAQTTTDANGVVTTSTYDFAGRLLTSTVKAISGCDTTADALCATDIPRTRTYNAGGGPLLTETQPNGGVTTYGYDARGRVASTTRTVTSTLSERMEYDYDNASGQKVAERAMSNATGSWVTARSVAYAYDAKRRLQRTTWPDAAHVDYTYDVANALAGVQDENHSVANTTYSYNANGRVAAVQQKLSTAAGGSITTSYGYDINDNLVSVTDPNGNQTTYAYDDFGRMIKQTSVVTGVTTYDYDLADNLTSTTDANGATTTRTYDALSRVTSAVSARTGSASETVGWSYDAATSGAFGIGRLTGTTYAAGTTTYAYERRGLLRSEQSNLGGASYTTGFRYDGDANRTAIVYPSGDTATYTFDLAGRPATMSGIITASSYLPYGPLTSLSYANGTTKIMQYDARYRVTENQLTTPGGEGVITLAGYGYSEDAAGNITEIRDETDPTYSRTFGYDELNRLVTANTGSSLWGTGAYAYDAMGNLVSRSLGQAPVDDGRDTGLSTRRRASAAVAGVVDRLAFTYSSTTPKIAVATNNGLDHTVAYDAAGNETQYYAGRTYTPRNLLDTVTDGAGEGTPHTLSYRYDARGVRVSRMESPVTAGSATRYFFYTPELQLIAMTVDDTANVWSQRHASITSAGLAMNHEFGYFAGIPVAEFGPARTPDTSSQILRTRVVTASLPATTLFYTFTDHLGTPLLQTDANRNIVWRAEHEPYGNVWQMRVGSRTDQPLRLPGQDLAMTWEGAEENYNVFRWYRAGWGRYTQADPVGIAFDTNLYAYAAEDPSGASDRLGAATVKITKASEQTYNTLSAYQSANPCRVNGASYSCTERLSQRLSCKCKCVSAGVFAMDVVIDVQLRYHLAGGPANSQLPSAAYWNAYRRHEDIHFNDLITHATAYANSLESNRYSTIDDCNIACGTAIGGFGNWMNQWAIDSNRRIH
jgi:RHS repeat-associated protein